jgi:AhpD family alkylhydroperoxidase
MAKAKKAAEISARKNMAARSTAKNDARSGAKLDDFQKFRADLKEEILGCGHLGIKRFFALDHQAYEPGALPTKTKELLGLVASMVLRCDDCITYHVVRCGEEGCTRPEVIDAMNVALVVGGSIVIPHLRRAFARMREVPALKP